MKLSVATMLGELEIRHAEDAVTARATVGQPRAETDTRSANEHPDHLSDGTETDYRVEYAQRPDRCQPPPSTAE